MKQPRNARARGERAGLDLDQIVETAKSFEVEKLTMQSLARAMNVDRKALNYYVKDREALLTILSKVQRNQVVNINAGFEYLFIDEVSASAGLFSNFSSAPSSHF